MSFDLDHFVQIRMWVVLILPTLGALIGWAASKVFEPEMAALLATFLKNP